MYRNDKNAQTNREILVTQTASEFHMSRKEDHFFMKKLKYLLLCCVMSVSVLFLAACGADNANDNKDNAGSNTESDNADAGTNSGNAADDAGDAVENTGDDIIDGAEDIGNDLEDAADDVTGTDGADNNASSNGSDGNGSNTTTAR